MNAYTYSDTCQVEFLCKNWNCEFDFVAGDIRLFKKQISRLIGDIGTDVPDPNANSLRLNGKSSSTPWQNWKLWPKPSTLLGALETLSYDK